MPPRSSQKRAGSGERVQNVASPAQQTESEIVEEVGAVRDEASGELLADSDRIREIGAVDAASVRENRRMADIAGKKRANMPKVPFNTDDVFTMYEILLAAWPANTIDIMVKRTTGAPVQHVITSHPRTGGELYEVLKGIHGQHPEAEYEVRFLDNGNKVWRGMGRIAMPDTRPQQAPQQGGQPMQHPYYPQPYGGPPPPQGYPQPAATPYPQPQGAPPQAPAAAPQAPPVHIVAPQPDPMAMMQQAFELFMRMQQQQPQAPPPPPAPAPYPTDPMAMMQQMFQMLQQLQQTQAAGEPPARGAQPQQQPQQNPMTAMMGMMGMAPPAGMATPPGHIWVPAMGCFVPLERLMQAMGGGPMGGGGAPDGARNRPSYGGRSAFGPGQYGGGQQGDGPQQQYRPPPPQRERSIADQLKEALAVVQTTVQSVQEINDILPGGGHAMLPAAPEAPEEEQSPVRVVSIGPAKAAVGPDGSTLIFESIMANSDKIFGWVGEQYDKVQKAKQQQPSAPPPSLPPGHVLVTPDYVPPPGYTVGPPIAHMPQQQPPQQSPQQSPGYTHQHAQQQSPLAPPPAFVPPPIDGASYPHPQGATLHIPDIQDEEEE